MKRLRRLKLTAPVCLALACTSPSLAQAQPSEHPFEIIPGSFHFAPAATQAGEHADWVTSFDFAHEPSGTTDNDVRNIAVNLPAGFVGNSTAAPTCTTAQLLAKTGERGELAQCPVASQVGEITLELSSGERVQTVSYPVYNLETKEEGVAAELGFRTLVFTSLLRISVRPGDEGLTVTTPNISTLGEVHNISFTSWALPASHIHDAERGLVCKEKKDGECSLEFGGPVEAHVPVKPFLSNPTSCGTFTATMEAYSWEEPFNVSSASTQTPEITGCERVRFEPSLEAKPTTRSGESATGLDVSLVVPQTYENPFTLASANLKDTVVTLPEGMTINPSAGSGLGACTPTQYQAETATSLPGQGCPPESKLGSIEIETPLLEEKIDGAVFLATPYENPFGSLLALYVVAKDPGRGIVIKTAGHIEPNPLTGRLVTRFENTPEQPFTKFTLKFRPGVTAPLVSPPACGAYSAQAALTPWSAPLEPRLLSSTEPFLIEHGAREGPCPSGGTPPLSPQVVSGTQNNSAASYSPFYLRLSREDGEQELTGFSTIMPPGLTGNLSGIPFCPEADIEAARSKSGREELASPSCPAASKVGHTIVEAGVGTVLAQTPGSLYLGGPFHGAPFSLVSVTSAVVGPFDLGTVVIRFALQINPLTAQVEVSPTGSEPIPHIIKGIVTHVRNIRTYVDRQSFILNPTSCEHLKLENLVTGAGADPANPADQISVGVSSPFQASDCASLAFKPHFSVSVTGNASKANGAGVSVKLAYPPGSLGHEANIAHVKVELPRQLPSRLSTLQRACLAKTFEANPASCPPESVVGHAKVITPILPVPLEGPAYFVSHGGEEFPNLTIVLKGYGVTIELIGSTFISQSGVTSTTFKATPDTPFESFELTLPQGPYSALASNVNLCASGTKVIRKRVTVRRHGHRVHLVRRVRVPAGPAKLVMPTEFEAQNGLEIRQATPIAVTGCPKAPAKRAKRARRRR
jgi:hypothetical protein